MKNSTQPNIRPLQQQDIEILADLYFPWSTREETLKKWSCYFKEQKENIRLSYIIEYQNQIAGYANLLKLSQYPNFREKNVPEIHDLWIYDQYRKKGLGTILIHYLEKLAKCEGHHQIGIGVGLYQDYGSAQKLYSQLGYIPDGNGVTYKNQRPIPGEKYPLDDDLILWLIKSIGENS